MLLSLFHTVMPNVVFVKRGWIWVFFIQEWKWVFIIQWCQMLSLSNRDEIESFFIKGWKWLIGKSLIHLHLQDIMRQTAHIWKLKTDWAKEKPWKWQLYWNCLLHKVNSENFGCHKLRDLLCKHKVVQFECSGNKGQV